jgi:2-amino-1-hydroxyethylphosphonate dioxygenase (glycine-forming)
LIEKKEMEKPAIEKVVNEVFSLYEQFGGEEYHGEPVSQLEHMSQSAALAIEGGHADEVVLAAFFHDIGHICVQKNKSNTMGEFGIKSHEKIGADFLREKGFPETIAKLVENHVQAKRYLTFSNPFYYAGLSEASKQTLEFQGGVMTQAEAKLFEEDPLFELSILMRRWDELGKETNVPVIDLEILKEKTRIVLADA